MRPVWNIMFDIAEHVLCISPCCDDVVVSHEVSGHYCLLMRQCKHTGANQIVWQHFNPLLLFLFFFFF